jgi:hypothetical protein
MTRYSVVVSCLAVVLLLPLACALEPSGRDEGAEEAFVASDQASPRAPAPEPSRELASLGSAGQGAPTPAPAERKLIRTVSLVLRVEDTKATAEALQHLAGEVGGFVGSMTAHRQGDLFHYALTLRVPVDELDAVLARIKEMAVEVDRESIQAEDVTDRFVDLEARLRTLRATETELQGLLAESRQRQYDAEDIMAVYRQLTEIRTQIEQIQGQLQVLGDLTSLATINVELQPTETARPVVEERWRPGETAKRATRGLVSALRFLTDFVIVAVVAVLPVLLIVILPIAVVVWFLVRRRRRAKARRTD